MLIFMKPCCDFVQADEGVFWLMYLLVFVGWDFLNVNHSSRNYIAWFMDNIGGGFLSSHNLSFCRFHMLHRVMDKTLCCSDYNVSNMLKISSFSDSEVCIWEQTLFQLPVTAQTLLTCSQLKNTYHSFSKLMSQ